MGKTAIAVKLISEFGKHPHVRGEDLIDSDKPFPLPETPPRAWGRLLTTDSILLPLGNTPTCVGKTGDGPGMAGGMVQVTDKAGVDPPASHRSELWK